MGSVNEPFGVRFLDDPGPVKVTLRPELYSTDPPAERFFWCLQYHKSSGIVSALTPSPKGCAITKLSCCGQIPQDHVNNSSAVQDRKRASCTGIRVRRTYKSTSRAALKIAAHQGSLPPHTLPVKKAREGYKHMNVIKFLRTILYLCGMSFATTERAVMSTEASRPLGAYQ